MLKEIIHREGILKKYTEGEYTEGNSDMLESGLTC